MNKSKLKRLAEKSGKGEAEIVIDTLNKTETAKEAAEEIGITYRTLWEYMKKYKIKSKTTWHQEKTE